jgi:D-2-hydroxyacid dehydrogenase (NADP+)
MRMLVHLESDLGTFQLTERQWQELRAALGRHELVRAASEQAFLAELPRAEAVVVWRFPEAWYGSAPRLRHVCTPAAGRELVALDPSGRVRAHFGSFHGPIMAESLLGMILFMKRRFGVAIAAQRERIWDRGPWESTRPLAGEIALLIGFGTIGAHCARLLRGLGVVVHGLRRNPASAPGGADRVFGAGELFSALPLADHVVCILPGDTDTDGLLGSAAFAHMKPSAFVYNLGRGNAIDPAALARALEARAIQGAFLDVVPEEPLPASSPLWSVPNLYLTPHSSAIRSDYLDRYFAELVAHFADA